MADALVRRAGLEDAEAIGLLLHDFNVEFEDVTPGPERLAERMRELIETGDTAVVIGGHGPDGLAVLRFSPAIWTDGLECYLAELYVAPSRRGRGLGRALMDAALNLARERGADYIYLATSEDDEVARALYERMGFSNREGKPDGPVMFVYEREL